MAGLDLRRQLTDVAMFDAELIVAGAVFFVVLAHRVVAERFQLREGFFEGQCR